MASDPADDDPFDDAPAVPLALRLAAVVWLAYSVIWVAGSVAVIVLAFLVGVGFGGGVICLTLPGVYSASVLMVAGVRVFDRSLHYVRWAAKMSLALGAVHLGLAAMTFAQSGGVSPQTLFALVTALWTPGALLIVAGVLALRVPRADP